MKRASRVIALVTTMMSVGFGCAVVIDLGDEAKLRPTEAGVDATDIDTGITDSGAPTDAPVDTGPEIPACGLARSPNAACAKCIAGSCCAEAMNCGGDPACVAGFECIKDCMVQFNCLLGCFGDQNAALSGVTNCSQANCSLCTPGPNCTKLGECGILFGDAGADLIIRNEVRSLILELDEAKCLARQRTLYKAKDAEACQPAP